MLCLTHEGATDVEIVPYLQAKFDPVTVLSIYGRCAKLEPPCPKNQAVWYGWRDRSTSPLR